ncbi:MAG: hypothetical protein ACP5VR_12345, partial [Acidimicrobiales bacterium]
GWTVVDDNYVEHERAATWLRVLLDAQGRSVGTARAYAGRLALYLTWASMPGVEPVAPAVDQLAAFARWLERTPSRKTAKDALAGEHQARRPCCLAQSALRPRSRGSWRPLSSSYASLRPGAGASQRWPVG